MEQVYLNKFITNKDFLKEYQSVVKIYNEFSENKQKSDMKTVIGLFVQNAFSSNFNRMVNKIKINIMNKK